MFSEGFSKAANMKIPTLKAPTQPLRGLHGAPRAIAKPARITPSTRPGNPVVGQNGLTGTPAMETFGRPLGGGFGKYHRKGLVSRSTVAGK